MRLNDLTGRRFGRLLVVSRAPNGNGGKTMWLCRCDCGNTKEVYSQSLIRGLTKSCGCYGREVAASRTGESSPQYRHGGEKTRLYRIWHGMKSRCYTVDTTHYPRYGGRGITVCDEWIHDFAAFREWALANGYQDDLSIDRIDNDGPYAPWNCRWATKGDQANNRRCTVNITLNGETRPISEWSKILGLSRNTIFWRYIKGLPPEEILKVR